MCRLFDRVIVKKQNESYLCAIEFQSGFFEKGQEKSIPDFSHASNMRLSALPIWQEVKICSLTLYILILRDVLLKWLIKVTNTANYSS